MRYLNSTLSQHISITKSLISLDVIILALQAYTTNQQQTYATNKQKSHTTNQQRAHKSKTFYLHCYLNFIQEYSLCL